MSSIARDLVSYDGVDDATSDLISAINHELDTVWLLISAFLVFFMQAGFAMLEAGGVRAKNTQNILLKNVLDACLGALLWWMVGFPFAYGERTNGDNGWIGANNFFLAQYSTTGPTAGDPYPIQVRGYEYDSTTINGFSFWIFQWAFAATAATIVSGAVAERCKFIAYLAYTIAITAFIYPVVVHWIWSSEGWLSAFHGSSGSCGGACDNIHNGAFDFAGSGVVHMTGGTAALVGAYILGPRIGRFDKDGKVQEIPSHSMPLATLGSFILWFGWYGFNSGSTLGLSNGLSAIAAKVAVVTTLSAAAGGASSLGLSRFIDGHVDLMAGINGILAGLVGSCSGAATIEPWAAVIVGGIAGSIYVGSRHLLFKLKIDDPLDASCVHLFCGAWGLFATGLFSTYSNTVATYGDGAAVLPNGDKYYGGFYGGGGTLLAVNIAAMLAIFAWVSSTAGILFFALKQAGLFRVTPEDEISGMDITHHGGGAYGYTAKGVRAAMEESTERLNVEQSSQEANGGAHAV